jgi:hypothetical protein
MIEVTFDDEKAREYFSAVLGRKPIPAARDHDEMLMLAGACAAACAMDYFTTRYASDHPEHVEAQVDDDVFTAIRSCCEQIQAMGNP